MRKQIFITTILSVFFFLNSVCLAADRLVPGEYPTIQAAIDASVNGDTVIISPGTYTGAGNRDIDFGGRAITVQSAVPKDPCVVAATVINCGGTEYNQHRGFYFHSGETNSSILSGITIKGGKIISQGGGIYCNSSSPTIQNCVISGNVALGAYSSVGNPNGGNAYGGGIYLSSNAIIKNCTISNNTALGGNGLSGSSFSVPGMGGGSFGGGIYSSSTAVISNCIITNNISQGGEAGYTGNSPSPSEAGWAYGGGIYGSISISNSTISYNRASGGLTDGALPAFADGGGLWVTGSTIKNCLIINNIVNNADGMTWEHNGGGIYTVGTNQTISNCTIYGNSAARYDDIGGGVYCQSGGTIINSIIWNNNGDLYNCSATYCCIKDNDIGTGNIHSDPCFVDGLLGNYYLSQIAAGQTRESPCVNAGSDTAANLGMESFTTRTDQIWDAGIVNMGYHYLSCLSDIDKNYFVDFLDFAILASNWQLYSNPCDSNWLAGDLTGDFHVDFRDLFGLASVWLGCFVEPAYSPNPADGAISVYPSVILGWSAGDGALSHNVYLGTGFNDVNSADVLSSEFKGNQTATICSPLNLDVNTTYYWRIDEIGQKCTTKGNIWNFKTWLQSSVLDPNLLVGWWKFDEGSGTVANDSSGHNNNGAVSGAAWTYGIIDGALEFSDEDSVSLAAIPTLAANTVTISAWVYADDMLVDNVVMTQIDPDGNGYIFGITGGSLLFALNDDPLGSVNLYSEISSGQWHHIVGTNDGSTLKIYVDGGAPKATDSSAGLSGRNYDAVIGYSDLLGWFSYGKTDDVRIYNRALSDAEVLQLYQDGL